MNKLKELREMNGFTKIDVSKITGITPETIRNIENSKSLSLKNAIILSKLYSKSTEEIYELYKLK